MTEEEDPVTLSREYLLSLVGTQDFDLLHSGLNRKGGIQYPKNFARVAPEGTELLDEDEARAAAKDGLNEFFGSPDGLDDNRVLALASLVVSTILVEGIQRMTSPPKEVEALRSLSITEALGLACAAAKNECSIWEVLERDMALGPDPEGEPS